MFFERDFYMRVIADVHEPKEIIHYLEREGVPVEIKSITPGDYVIGKIGIERKSISDFIQSIIKRRIFDQIQRLSQSYDRSLLILEGDLSEIIYFRDYRPFLGALLAISLDFNTQVIYTRGKEETAYAIKLIWRRLLKESETVVIRYKPKYLSPDDWKIFILEGFPEIGPKLAKNLLIRFKTLRNVFNATISQLMDVEGIGEKKAEELYNLINSPYRSGK